MTKLRCPVALVLVGTLAVIAVGILAVHFATQTTSQSTSSPATASALNQEKLILEVAQLRHQTGLWGNLQPFVPVAGAVVALLALAGTTLQYLRDRKRDRELRIEEGIANSTNTLTKFPGDPDAGIGTVVAALRNLGGFVDRSMDSPVLRDQITEILATVAREDLDYRNARDARFDSLCFEYWEPYRGYQCKNPKENLYVLEQYLEALDELERTTGLVKSATFSSTGIRNIPPGVNNSDITRLTRLVTGYGLRLALLPSQEAPDAERRFLQVAGGNESLRERMLQSGPIQMR
jgi:hypothetical protein